MPVLVAFCMTVLVIGTRTHQLEQVPARLLDRAERLKSMATPALFRSREARTMANSLTVGWSDTVVIVYGGPTQSIGSTLPPIDDSGGSEAPTAAQLELLVREHLDAVYRVALSIVRDSALAEDVAQDALLKAWRALPEFRGDSSMRSWLLRITHNTAISTIRKRREELREPELLPERAHGSSTEGQVMGSMSVDAFELALDALDKLSRSIVVLREIEGMSYEEISETLEVPLPTVKTRLLRARRVLANALEGWS